MTSIKTTTILSAILILAMVSCKKETTPVEGKVSPKKAVGLFSTGTTTYDGYISYVAQCESWRDSSNAVKHRVYYFGDADFYDNPVTRSFNVGSISWGGISVLADSTKYGRCTYFFNQANSVDSVNNNQFGGNTTFAISGGSGFASLNKTLYVPEEIYIVPENYNCASPVIKNSLLPKVIQWNSDPNNSNGVEVMIEYNGFRSNLKNPAFSNASFFTDPVNVTDNGSCSITSSMLSGIPYGAIVTIHIGRAAEVSVTDANGKVVVISAMTYTSQDYVYEP